MAYERNTSRPGDDRWRDRSREQYRGRDDNDRGFFDRAGDEVRSWFGDDDAERRRDADARRYERERGSGSGRDRDFDERWSSDYGRGTAGGFGNQRGWSDDRWDTGSQNERARTLHDPHYAEWRERQISALDRDYDDYRREHQSKFEQDFGNWRDKRQGQRQSLRQVAEHMEVVGSDGAHVGKVDHVRDDRIILAKNDEAAGGRHHSIPCGWIDKVDDKVTINRSAEDAFREWRDAENSRALFEREDRRSDGPHTLDRSFSGTYGDKR